MATNLSLTDPTQIVKVGIMALVAFAIFKTVANVAGQPGLAARIPS